MVFSCFYTSNEMKNSNMKNATGSKQAAGNSTSFFLAGSSRMLHATLKKRDAIKDNLFVCSFSLFSFWVFFLLLLFLVFHVHIPKKTKKNIYIWRTKNSKISTFILFLCWLCSFSFFFLLFVGLRFGLKNDFIVL